MESTPTLDHATLKARHRAQRDAWHPNLNLRVHRALSWLHRAELSVEDDDARFVFLWIAFNAAYANEFDLYASPSEQASFGVFLERLIELDQQHELYRTLWEEFPGSVRVLLDNRYVFKPFWDHVNGRLSEQEWERQFVAARRAAHTALGRNDTATVLSIVCSRLYMLRNQIIHGGATWNSRVNRSQIRDAVGLLGRLVPVIIHIMMNHPARLWGDPCFPVVER